MSVQPRKQQKAYDHILWQDSNLTIGTFTARPLFSDFNNTGPAQGHLLVFANHPVIINKRNQRYIANHNTVMFYNRGDEYTREALSEEGDFAHWIRLSRVALDGFNGLCGIDSQNFNPFQSSQVNSNNKIFWLQKQLFKLLETYPKLESLIVYELVAQIVEQVVDQNAGKHSVSIKQKKHILSSVDYISRCYRENINLEQLAKESCLSPFHLCRVFKKFTGFSIHQYIINLRLKEALNEVCDSQKSLSDIALDLNFSSHSHFSSIFKREYGVSPKKLRIDSCLPIK
ncbi:MAG: helix-turn-helix transcriptional regulator [Kangiellaceae bacterium]|nr:helix-turn-helix transcriptional regulator [Kangiellaceae bacterium]